jgi:hypothetical protein
LIGLRQAFGYQQTKFLWLARTAETGLYPKCTIGKGTETLPRLQTYREWVLDTQGSVLNIAPISPVVLVELL